MCSEEEMYCEFISHLIKIRVCIDIALGIIIFLVNLQEVYGDIYYEFVWGIMLIV